MVSEEDPEVAMVCMAGAQCGQRFGRKASRNPEPTDGGDFDGTFEGHVTPVIDDEAPPISKNTRASLLLYSKTQTIALLKPPKVLVVTSHHTQDRVNIHSSWPGKPTLRKMMKKMLKKKT